ncbi:MAG: RDD family protein [Candidatus Thorarchaeota archaeon]
MTDLDVFLIAIGHPLRRRILETVYANPEISYSQILSRINISSGKLNFHLQKLDQFLAQVDGQYQISNEGLKLYRIWKKLEGRLSGTETHSGDTPGFFVIRRTFGFLTDIILILCLLFIAADFSSIALEPAWWLGGFPVPIFITRIVEMMVLYPPDLNVVLIRAFVLAILWMYFTILEGYQGQTIGKMLFGIRIVDVSGARMNPHAAAIRALTKVLVLPFDILIGLIKSRKAGFLRFFAQYTRTWVVRS